MSSESTSETEMKTLARPPLAIWQIIVLLLVFYLSQTLASALLLVARHGLDVDALRVALGHATELQQVLVASGFATALCFIALLVWFAKRRHMTMADFGLVRPANKWLLFALLCVPLSFAFGKLTEWMSGQDFLAESLRSSFGFVTDRPIWTVLAGIVIIIVMPFVEELFFRATLYGSFRKYMRPLFAGTLASLIFVAMHAQYTLAGGMFALVATAQLVVLASMLMVLYAKSASLFPPVLLHAINNALAFSMSVYYWQHPPI